MVVAWAGEEEELSRLGCTCLGLPGAAGAGWRIIVRTAWHAWA